MKGGPGRPLTRGLALVAGALGLGALRRALRRGRAEVDPAAGLRAKLDEARRAPGSPPVEPVEATAAGGVEKASVRASAEPPSRGEAGETDADPGGPDVDRRREDVHARARRAIDELRS